MRSERKKGRLGRKRERESEARPGSAPKFEFLASAGTGRKGDEKDRGDGMCTLMRGRRETGSDSKPRFAGRVLWTPDGRNVGPHKKESISGLARVETSVEISKERTFFSGGSATALIFGKRECCGRGDEDVYESGR